MKMLYITTANIYGTSSSNIRNVSLIIGLTHCGHHVEILTFKVDEKNKNYDSVIADKLKYQKIYFLKNHSLQKIFALKKHTFDKKRKRFRLLIYRIIKKYYLRFSITDTLSSAVNAIDIKEMPNENYDVIISSSDPISSHLLARKYIQSRKVNALWYQYWGDPLYYDITRSNNNKQAMKKFEHQLLAKCDRIVYTNGLVLDEQKKLYFDISDKMSFVPTPYAFMENKLRAKEVFDIGYFGSYMSSVRNILPLVNVANSSRRKLIVMGGGDQIIKESSYVCVKSFQSVREVSKFENMCKVLVCICNYSNKEPCLQIPGKVYHYSVTDKPILIVGATPNIREYLEQFNRFYFAANNENDIRENLSIIYEEKNYTQKNAILEDFLPTSVAKIFLSKTSS